MRDMRGNLPRVLGDRVEPKLLCDLDRSHRAGEVLLVGKDEKRGGLEIVVCAQRE